MGSLGLIIFCDILFVCAIVALVVLIIVLIVRAIRGKKLTGVLVGLAVTGAVLGITIIMMLFSLYLYAKSGNNETNSQDPEVITEDTDEDMEDEDSDSRDVMSMYRYILEGESNFYLQDEDYATTYIDQMDYISGTEFEEYLTLLQFYVVDMDQDGEPEVVVELTDNTDGWLLVLHAESDYVVGYGFGYRAMQSIKEDGSFMFSNGADSNGFGQIRFEDDEVTMDVLADCDGDTYYVDGEEENEDTYYDFTEEWNERDDAEPFDYTTDNIEEEVE